VLLLLTATELAEHNLSGRRPFLFIVTLTAQAIFNKGDKVILDEDCQVKAILILPKLIDFKARPPSAER
jgi:hypothetical protein